MLRSVFTKTPGFWLSTNCEDVSKPDTPSMPGRTHKEEFDVVWGKSKPAKMSNTDDQPVLLPPGLSSITSSEAEEDRGHQPARDDGRALSTTMTQGHGEMSSIRAFGSGWGTGVAGAAGRLTV